MERKLSRVINTQRIVRLCSSI